MISKIDHSGFVVNDLDAAIAFFTEVLGFGLVRNGNLVGQGAVLGVPEQATGRFQFLEVGGSQIELLEWNGVEQKPAAGNAELGGRHLALRSTDLAGLLTQIGEIESAIIREPSTRGFVYVSLPFGLELQLIPAD